MIAPLIYHRKNPAFLRAGMETFSNIFSQRFQRPDNAFTHRLNGHALGLGNLGSTHAHKEKGRRLACLSGREAKAAYSSAMTALCI